ncbi:hypothetical protein KCU65_g3422, partial [Aureobasidium melanogenum]
MFTTPQPNIPHDTSDPQPSTGSPTTTQPPTTTDDEHNHESYWSDYWSDCWFHYWSDDFEVYDVDADDNPFLTYLMFIVFLIFVGFVEVEVRKRMARR